MRDCARAGTLGGMSFLLPQDRAATVNGVKAVDIHGDRYQDLLLAYDGESAPQMARVPLSECPQGLVAGERVNVRIVMGVVTRLARA